MKQHVLFFDYDGTLYPGKGDGISKRTIAALKALQNAGHKIALCTGRCIDHVPNEMKELPFDGYILACGSQILVDGKELFCSEMSRESIIGYLKLAEKYGQCGALEGTKLIYYNTEEHECKFDTIKSVEEFQRDFPDVAIEKLSIFKLGLEKEIEEYLKKYDYQVIVSQSYMEVLQRGINKGTGVRMLAEAFGVEMENTVGFGDSHNDLSMLNAVGRSVAMGNAPEDVRLMADETTLSVVDDGVAFWIENNLEILGR